MSSSPTTTSSSLPSEKPQQQIAIPEPTQAELTVGESAITEFTALATGRNLADQKQLNEVKKLFREDRSETHLHRITCIYFYAIGIMGLCSVTILAWHWFTPESLHFLTAEQQVRVEELLVSGGAGVFLDRASRRVR